eukprot:5086415-Amphidinium_carterae.1
MKTPCCTQRCLKLAQWLDCIEVATHARTERLKHTHTHTHARMHTHMRSGQGMVQGELQRLDVCLVQDFGFVILEQHSMRIVEGPDCGNISDCMDHKGQNGGIGKWWNEDFVQVASRKS